MSSKTVEYGIKFNIEGDKHVTDAIHAQTEATKEYGAAVANANKSATAAVQEGAQATSKYTIGQQLFIEKMQEHAAAVGKSRIELLQYKAAELGVTQETERYIARIAEASKETHAHGQAAHGAAGGMGQLNFQTVGARRELLVLMHELSQGNFQKFGGSLMVLGEQTGAASLLFSAAGVAALALGAAVIGVGYAMYKGASDQKHMQDALIMTGNFAGETSDSLDALAHHAVEAGGSIREAKKVVAELAGTGKYSGEQIGIITSAVIAMEHATGASVEKSIKMFETLAVQTSGNSARATEAISRATLKLDDQYHFLTEAVYEHIRALEKDGQAKEASALATDVFANTMKHRSEEIIANAGHVAKAWHWVKEAIAGAGDEIGRWGAKATPGSEVARLKKEIADIDSGKYLPVQGAHRTGLAPSKENLADLRAADVIALTKAEAALVEEQGKAEALRKKALVQSDASHAASRIAADDIKLQRKGMSELSIALLEYQDDVAKVYAANPKSDLVKPEVIAAHIAAIKKAHSTKPTEDKAENTRLADQLKRIQAETKAEEDTDRYLLQVNELYHKAGMRSDEEFYEEKVALLGELAANEKLGLDKQIAALRAHNKLTEAEEERRTMAINDLQDKKAAVTRRYHYDTQLLGEQERVRKDEIVRSSDDAHNKFITALTDEAVKQENANVVQEQSRAEIERKTIALNNQALASLRNTLLLQQVTHATDEEIEATEKLIKGLEDENTARERIAAAAAKNSSRKLDDKLWKEAESGAKEFAKTMESAFGSAGGAIGKLTLALIDHQKVQREIAAELAHGTSSANGDQGKIIEAETKARRDSAQAQLKQYGDITHAASGFFDKSSKGYQILHTTEQAFRAFEMAMTVKSTVEKLFSIGAVTSATVASETVKTAATVEGTATAVAANVIEGESAAAVAVANQAKGDPYTAWPRMAAMAAAMAAIGFAVGGMGGSGPSDTSADKQKANGTGSVLGAEAAKSESISRAIETLQKNSNIGLTHSQGMLSALVAIRDNIGGIATLVSQTAGLRATPIDSKAVGVGSSPGFLGIGATSTSIQDSGIHVAGGQTVGSVINNGFNATGYTDVQKKNSGFFGLFSSDSVSRQGQALSAELTRQFSLVIGAMKTGTLSAVESLGISGKSIVDNINSMAINLDDISFKGLSGADIEKELEATFSKIGDDMARLAAPTVAPFEKAGEGMYETLVRVSSGVELAKDSLSRLGLTAIAYTDIINKQGDVGAEIVRQTVLGREASGAFETVHTAEWTEFINQVSRELDETGHHFINVAESIEVLHPATDALVAGLTGVGKIMQTMTGTTSDLVDAYKTLVDIRSQMNAGHLNGANLSAATIGGAGGLSLLQDGVKSFLDKYLSPSEKVAVEMKGLSDQFELLGQKLPANKLAYRELVTGIDTTTDAGARLQGQLLALGGAFSDAVDHAAELGTALDAEGAAKDVATAQQSVNTNLRSLSSALQSFSDKAVSTGNAVLTQLNAISTAYFAAQDGVLAAQQKVIDLSRQEVDGRKKASASIKDYLDNLDGTGKRLTPDVLNSKLEATAALARGGDAKAQEAVTGAADKFLKAFKASSGSEVDYLRQEARVRVLLNGVISANDKRIADLVKVTPEADTAAADPLIAANKELLAAQLKLVGISTVAAATSASTDRSTLQIAGSAGALLAAFEKAHQDDLVAQANYAAAVGATAGIALHASGSLDGFFTTLSSLGVSQAALAKAQAALSTAISTGAAATTISLADYAKSLGLSGAEAKAFTDVMTAAHLTTSGYKTLMAITGLSATELSTALSSSGIAADQMAVILASSKTEAGTFADRLKAGHLTVAEFTGHIQSAGLDAATLVTALGLSTEAAQSLADSIGPSGTAATTLTTKLISAYGNTDEFKRLIGLANLTVPDFTAYLSSAGLKVEGFKGVMESTGLSAGALASLIGATDASGLRGTLVASGLSLKDFIALADATGLPFKTFKSALDNGGISAKDFKDAIDATGKPAKDLFAALGLASTNTDSFKTAIGTAGTKSDNLTSALVDSTGKATALAVSLGLADGSTGKFNASLVDPTGKATVLAVSLGLADSATGTFKTTITAANSNANAFKASLGFAGTATDDFVNLLKSFKLPEATIGNGTTTATTLTSTGAINAFVEGLYQEILGRHSDSGGLEFWTNAVMTGALSLSNAAAEIAKAASIQNDNPTGPHAAGWVAAQAVQDDAAGTAWLKSHNISYFASGAAFTNGVVSRPTNFNIGQMGEKDSEAIMPLTNIGGSLGVRAIAPGQSELINEVRAMRLEIAAQRAEMAAMRSEKIITDHAKISAFKEGNRIFDRASQGKNSIRVKVVT